MGEAKRRKQLLGSEYGKPHTSNNPKRNTNRLPNPEKVRYWTVLEYSPIQKTYIFKCEDIDSPMSMLSCLYCDEPLEEGKKYTGYKDVKNKKLILVKYP